MKVLRRDLMMSRDFLKTNTDLPGWLKTPIKTLV